jgi:hypothetical protein
MPRSKMVTLAVYDDEILLGQIDDVPIVSVPGNIDVAKTELLDRALNVLDAEMMNVVAFASSLSVDGSAIVTVLHR